MDRESKAILRLSTNIFLSGMAAGIIVTKTIDIIKPATKPYQRALCSAAQEIPQAKAYFEGKGVQFETHYSDKDGKPYYLLAKKVTEKDFPAPADR
jgi:hypothetical protein